MVYCVLSGTFIRVGGAADGPKPLEPIKAGGKYLRSVIHPFDLIRPHGSRETKPRE